jgi:hypothetical protein
MNLDFKKFSFAMPEKSGDLIMRLWRKLRTVMFLIFSLAWIIPAIYVYKQSVMDASWSEEKKQEYINSQNKQVVFKEDDFNKTIADIQFRKNFNLDSYQSAKDIFAPYNK